MAIRDLFKGDVATSKAAPTKAETVDSIFGAEQGTNVESAENVAEKIKQKDRFVPDVDFSTASNFARFGSAEEYYRSSIKRVYQQYPYDGSEAEKNKFRNQSTFLDLYVLDKLYPSSTGYAVFAPAGWGDQGSTVGGWGSPSSNEFIAIKGGPHTSSGGLIGEDLYKAFDEPINRTSPNSNTYDESIYDSAGVLGGDRVGSNESNLKFDLSKGVSTEFWLKKGDWITSLTEKEVIFDLWNGKASSSADYGRLLVFVSGTGVETLGANPFRVHLASGSEYWDMSFGGSTHTTSSLSNAWKHVAFTFLSSSEDSELQAKFYIDGDLQSTTGTTHIVNFGEITGSLIGYLGALQTTPSGNLYHGKSMTGDGKLSGSIDEFRYWKSKRTSENIGQNWFTQVGGGTNEDVANAELGVYFKFNEGIVGATTSDSVVLDYSGRISNGDWTGYSSASRNTGSAIVSASAAVEEFEDPIIYSTHSDVDSLLTRMIASGAAWDNQNNSRFAYNLPSYILEEDEESSKDVLYLTQIMSSYLDDLHLQIDQLSNISHNNYFSSGSRGLPFVDKLLTSKGFVAPDMFGDAEILNIIGNRDEDRNFELELYEVKNKIYQNVYNNLSYILKSKGTEKSFRNLIRCFGVDEDLIKINLYSDNGTTTLKNNYRLKSTKKRYVNFNTPTNNTASVYQQSSSTDSNTTDVTYISGSDELQYLANTAEIEVVFPKQFPTDHNAYVGTSFQSSSIFGHHTASNQPNAFEWPPSAVDFNFELYAIRPTTDDSDAYFVIKDRAGNFTLSSSLYNNVYEDERWNFAVRVKNDKFPIGGLVTGSSGSASGHNVVTLEFYGVNVVSDIVKNEFLLTASSLDKRYLTGHRRYYVGANRTNFSGAVVHNSDVKVSSLRHWGSYLEDSDIREHAINAESYGAPNPYKSSYQLQGVLSSSNVPQIDTLALNWDYSEVTSSNVIGEFTVEDFSSGSIVAGRRYPGTFGEIVGNLYAGRGIGFAPSSTSSVSTEYISNAKHQLPESISGEDMISVLQQDDITFGKDNRPVDHYITFEKSLYQTISEEMMNMFGSIVEFNNLIGNPVNRYRQDYKELGKLRQLFFEQVQNTPDVDKFISYYIWLDSAMSQMIQQLIPLSSNASGDILNVIESHVLERNKYRSKFPMLENKESTEVSIRGHHEMNYSWKNGHAPLPETAATATWTFTDKPNEATTITLTDVQGTSVVFEVDNDGDGGAGSNTEMDPATNNAAGMSAILISKVNASALKITATTGGGSTGEVLLTQDIKGEAGNITIALSSYSNWNANTSAAFPTKFTGGSTPENENAFWWKERAEVTHLALSQSRPFVNDRREELREVIISKISGTAPTFKHNPAYSSSLYNVRTMPGLYSISGDVQKLYTSGDNSNQDDKKYYYRELIEFSKATGLIIEDIEDEVYITDDISMPKSLQKIRKRFRAGGEFKQNVAPFTIMSSSTPSRGYNTNLYSNFKSNVDITNNHTDTTFGNEISMQSPFTEKFVGGSFHRHADLNQSASAKTLTGHAGGLDSTVERIEAYDMTLASDKITIAHRDINKPRSSYFREEVAKRPVNIRNIKLTTGSGPNPAVTQYVSGTLQSTLGNFSNIHEVVQTSDRSTNNSSYVKAGGFGSSSAISHLFSDVVDFEKPSRRRTGHVFVERFSAPGGPETAGDNLGGAGLDFESAQFSPYNDMNTRNSTVRTALKTLLQERAEQFGIRSGSSVRGVDYDTLPSYHDVNRNAITRWVYINPTDTAATASSFDNYYVQHEIPRSDLQYSWITSSYLSTHVFDHAPPDGKISSSAVTSLGAPVGVVPAITFTSASSINTASFIVDFVGLNTLIHEPFTSSTGRRGYPTAQSLNSYRNTALHFPPTGGLRIGSHSPVATDGNEVLNALLLHRNGPYSYPSWKQLRNDENPIVRYWRRNSTIAINPDGEETNITVVASSAAGDGYTIVTKDKYGGLRTFTEPAVMSRNLPLTINLGIKNGTSDVATSVKSSFSNDLDYFGNASLNNALALPETQATSYDSIKSLYLEGGLANAASPVNTFINLTYTQNVWPKPEHAFQNRTRERNNYENNFWRKVRTDRDSLGDRKYVSNGALSGAYSAWAMDADNDFSTDITGTTAGILQNNTTHMFQKDVNGSTTAASATEITASILFHRKHGLASTGSVRKLAGLQVVETGSTNLATATEPLGDIQIGGGNAVWEVDSGAGFYSDDGTFNLSPSSPWYDDYSEFSDDLRTSNKDMSIIPEFRISEHIKKYMNVHNGNFLADNESYLSIFGAPSGSSLPQNSSETDFYDVYTNSDFMKHFATIRKDHEGFADASEITLTCEALTKFVPYDGFYPSELLVDLYNTFSSSYGNFVQYDGATSNLAAGLNAKIRPFIAPMFAPGIWCNTIKSGIAVDYPVYTGSYVVHSPKLSPSGKTTYKLLSTSSLQSLDGFDLRVPFDALVQPEKYLTNMTLVDMEASFSSSANITASWTGEGSMLYKMRAHNALSSMIEFFLQGEGNKGDLTTIKSLPEDQFQPFVSGTTYAMRVKLRKSYNKPRQENATFSRGFTLPQDTAGDVNAGLEETITICSRPSSFGPPVAGRKNISFASGTAKASYPQTLDSLTGINPAFTPPYYDGECWCDITYTHATSTQPTLKDIQRDANLTHFRFDPVVWNGGSNYQPYGKANINHYAMQLTSSVDVLGRISEKSVEYDALGNPITVKDDETQTSDVWVIQPKFETPILNIQGAPMTIPTNGSASATRSIWSQFGRIPTGSEGIFLEVVDINESWLNNRADKFENQDSGFADSDSFGARDFSNLYTLYGSGSKVESLSDMVGFQSPSKNLGQLADLRTVKEAIVAIPFLEIDGKRSFFDVPKDQIDAAVSMAAGGETDTTAGDSIVDMVNKMQNYVIPPKFDFIKNSDFVEPFAMYIFEFSYTFDRDDLSYIWQNMQPRSSKLIEKSTASINHKLLAHELMGEAAKNTGKPLQDELRWMVFKVKQKSATNYFDKIVQYASSDDKFDFDFNVGTAAASAAGLPDYSFNWPYDNFSIVELAKLNTEVKFTSVDPAEDGAIQTSANALNSGISEEGD